MVFLKSELENIFKYNIYIYFRTNYRITNLYKKVPGKKVSGKKPGNKNFGKKSKFSQVLGKNVTGNKVLCFGFLELFYTGLFYCEILVFFSGNFWRLPRITPR